MTTTPKNLFQIAKDANKPQWYAGESKTIFESQNFTAELHEESGFVTLRIWSKVTRKLIGKGLPIFVLMPTTWELNCTSELYNRWAADTKKAMEA